MKLVLLEEAQLQFEEEDVWWRENRDAKELFIEEFSAVLGRISSMPEAAAARSCSLFSRVALRASTS